jgi:hypothetical protein
MTRLIGGNISDTPVKNIGDGSAFSAGGAETDPLFANVELLLMPEAGDASILDKSSNARTVTNTGPVSIVSDVNSPTGYAMDFGNEANLYYLTFSDDAGLKPGTGDFCIETIALSTNTTSGAGSMTGAGAGGTTGSTLNFPWFYSTTTGPTGYPGATNSGCNNSNVTSTNSGVTWNAGGYHHWAFTRSGTTTRVFCDGYEEASGTNSTDVGATNWTAFLLGMWSLPSTRVFAGKVAMFRLTLGAARYTSNFSPFSEFPKV